MLSVSRLRSVNNALRQSFQQQSLKNIQDTQHIFQIVKLEGSDHHFMCLSGNPQAQNIHNTPRYVNL